MFPFVDACRSDPLIAPIIALIDSSAYCSTHDPSPLISYSEGQWVEGSPTNDSFAADYSQGSFKVTFTAGASATLTFLGDSITLYGAKRPNHGNYTVVLDNDEPGFTGDGNGNNIFQFALWNAQNLTYGQHTAVITNNPTSQGNFFDVDFFSIGREIGPSGYNGPISNVTIDDESSFFVYNSSTDWSTMFSGTALNNSLHLSTQAGDSVSFFFQGSSVELYGLYVNAPFKVQIDDQLPRDLAGPNVDLNSQQQHPQTLLYYMDGLDENKTHVVTLTNTVTNAGRPLYIDYAVVRSSQEFASGVPSPDPSFTVPTTTSISTSSSTSTTTTSSGSSSISQSQSFPVGAVVGGVVGGIGGLIVLALVGFILLRRSRRYSSRSSTANEEERSSFRPSTILSRESRSTNTGISPFILPRITEDSSSSFQSPGSSIVSYPSHHRKSRLEGRSMPSTRPSDQSTLHSNSPSESVTVGSRHSLTSSQDHAAPGPPSPILNAPPPTIILGDPSGQPQGNTLITQTYYLQESDAGRIIQTRLPPVYNANWQPPTP